LPSGDDYGKTRILKIAKVNSTKLKNIKDEFDQVKKEVTEIINKFKTMQLSKVLKVYSEMEGIEFNWNN